MSFSIIFTSFSIFLLLFLYYSSYEIIQIFIIDGTEDKHIMAKIMLVDDSKFIKRKLADILIPIGHTIIYECDNGDMAVTGFRLYKPDLITMDINMPGMNGLDAITEIKKINENAKIIIISAASNEKTIIEGINRGASGFIVKPFANDNVIRTVNKTLSADTAVQPPPAGKEPVEEGDSEITINGLVLIIDDSNVILQSTSDLLKKDGQNVMTAHSGAEGIKLASAGIPDLIMLDIEMPGMDGYDVINALKKDDFTKNIPIIMYTSKTKKDDILLAMKLGIIDYIAKDSDKKVISTKIRTCLKQAKEKKTVLEKNNVNNIIIDRKSGSTNISFRFTMKSEKAIEERKKVFTGAFLKTISETAIIFDIRLINNVDKGELIQLQYLYSLFPEKEIISVCGKHYETISSEFDSNGKDKFFFSTGDSEIYIESKN